MIIEANIIQIFISYLVAIIISIVVALLLRLPLLPNKPRRFSWVNSAIYPTPVIALGIMAILHVLGLYGKYNGLILACIIGILSALFVKYLFYYIFPKPQAIVDSEENNENNNDLKEDN